ncbi:MAG TPA: hypothetical protein VKX17_01870 [Planctomycetota bacterium]|nr:hypothetical protein [Planctomycetota bacterium]
MLVPHAFERICACGRFNPVGAWIHADGKVTPHVGRRAGKNPATGRYFISIAKKFRLEAQAGRIRAAAFCCSATVALPDNAGNSQAIRCSLEHKNGDAYDAFVPYAVNRHEKEIEFGPVFATKRQPAYF